MSIQRINSALAAVLIGVMPTLLLTEIGHASIAWYVLVLLSLGMWFTRENGISATLSSLRPYRVVALSLAYPFLPVVLVMLFYHVDAGAELERAARGLFGYLFVLGAVLSLKPGWLRQSSWGFVLAGLASATYVFWPAERGDFGRPMTPEFNAVSYGNLMLLFAVLVVYSIRWSLTAWPRAEKSIKWVAALVTFIAFVLTETRTGWLALPVFALIGLYLSGWVKGSIAIVYTALGLIVLFAVMSLSIPKLQSRLTLGYQEVGECFNVNALAFTSTCIRIQLWRSSVDMFAQQPWLGVGLRRNFQPALQARVSQGLVSQEVADDWAEPHNDMMMVLATQGALGGLGLLLMYFAPAWVFVRRLSVSHAVNVRVAAAMGLAVCLGFAIFGLTELMFRGMRTVGFYAIMIAWLMALSDPRSETQASCEKG